MLFYGYSSHVRFSTEFEAIAAYLGLHSEMIHLIRVITFVWDAVLQATVSLLFSVEKANFKLKEVLTWHISQCPYRKAPRWQIVFSALSKARLLFLPGGILFVRLETTSRIPLWFPQKREALHHVATVFQCVMGQNGESVSTNWEWCSGSANFRLRYCERLVRQLQVWDEICPK